MLYVNPNTTLPYLYLTPMSGVIEVAIITRKKAILIHFTHSGFVFYIVIIRNTFWSYFEFIEGYQMLLVISFRNTANFALFQKSDGATIGKPSPTPPPSHQFNLEHSGKIKTEIFLKLGTTQCLNTDCPHAPIIVWKLSTTWNKLNSSGKSTVSKINVLHKILLWRAPSC